MSWGYKIMAVVIIFIIAMCSMVYVAMQQKNEMFDDKYYVKELKHQDLINAEKNLNALSENLRIIDSNNLIIVSIPSTARQAISEGTIAFLRPSDESKDTTLPLILDRNGMQLIGKNAFIKGMYKVRVNWKSNEKPYYTERSIFVE